jgi:hypothetical protein
MIDIDDLLLSIDREHIIEIEKENPSMDDVLFSLNNENVHIVTYTKNYKVNIFDTNSCTIVYDTNKNCYYCNFLLNRNESDIIQNIKCDKEIGVVFGSNFKYRYISSQIKSIPLCHLMLTPVFLSIVLHETPEHDSVDINISYTSIMLNHDLRIKMLENDLTSNGRIFTTGTFLC